MATLLPNTPLAYEKRPLSGDEFVALVSSDAFAGAVSRAMDKLPRMSPVMQLVFLTFGSDVAGNIVEAAFSFDKAEASAAIKRAAPDFDADMNAGMGPLESAIAHINRARDQQKAG